jgi:alkylhydroperoxidase/carboxymuconolactone decarboxylase family protein YurZ
MRVDPMAGSIDTPQSLNRYSYAQNDPGNLFDPLGLDVVTPPISNPRPPNPFPDPPIPTPVPAYMNISAGPPGPIIRLGSIFGDDGMVAVMMNADSEAGLVGEGPLDGLADELLKKLMSLLNKQFDDLNECEKKAVLHYKTDSIILLAVIAARERADEVYGHYRGDRTDAEADGTFANAILHCVWSCEMTRNTHSSIIAQEWGEAHECVKDGSKLKNDPDSVMDLHNNKVGRDLAEGEGDCGARCATSKDIQTLR